MIADIVICPRCGEPGKVRVRQRGKGRYLYVRHRGGKECYIGKDDPENRAKLKPALRTADATKEGGGALPQNSGASLPRVGQVGQIQGEFVVVPAEAWEALMRLIETLHAVVGGEKSNNMRIVRALSSAVGQAEVGGHGTGVVKPNAAEIRTQQLPLDVRRTGKPAVESKFSLELVDEFAKDNPWAEVLLQKGGGGERNVG